MNDSNKTPVQEMPKVYLLPNLLTAGNLFCGFMAILQIIQGSLEHSMTDSILGSDHWIKCYERSLWFILGACICDLLDGRLARLGGKESAFGREFDSLADLVSFGLAPSLMVYKIILADLPEDFRWVGSLVAFVYLVAGAMRLARFNVVSAQPHTDGNKDFIGFSIPAAAGLVASITLFLLHFYKTDKEIGNWRYLLPVLLLILSCMMYSRIRYPSFKNIDWKAKRSLPNVILTFLALWLVVKFYWCSLAIVFLAYLVYGFVRPFVSQRIRANIEEEEDEDTPEF
jgi:CDP-diacylglycerol--serine O-phosphatidyltransferase